MNTIRITKEFNFEMAHALYGYDGLCKNIHGHSYHLAVTIIGKAIVDKNNPQNGMVMDFSFLKNMVTQQIISPFDHALTLNKNSPHQYLGNDIAKTGAFSKVMLVPYQPTCENLLVDFATRIQKHLTEQHTLLSLKLRETPSSFAEWFYVDNN